MPNLPADYLTIAHLTKDLAASGYTLGGTAAYASLTARNFGLKTVLLTAGSGALDLKPLAGIEIHNKLSPYDTTFENIQTPAGRVQMLHETAETLTPADIPERFHTAPIVHIGPVAHDADEGVVEIFSPDSLIGITPQGWMRRRDETGRVFFKEWHPQAALIERADAVVLSDEDVHRDESIINDYAQMFRLLVVTEGYNGARVYWHGDARHFSAPQKDASDPTGAGDIFAAAFFIRLKSTQDPWASAAIAVQLASLSVTRRGLQSVPRPEEVQSELIEILKGSSSA